MFLRSAGLVHSLLVENRLFRRLIIKSVKIICNPQISMNIISLRTYVRITNHCAVHTGGTSTHPGTTALLHRSRPCLVTATTREGPHGLTAMSDLDVYVVYVGPCRSSICRCGFRGVHGLCNSRREYGWLLVTITFLSSRDTGKVPTDGSQVPNPSTGASPASPLSSRSSGRSRASRASRAWVTSNF